MTTTRTGVLAAFAVTSVLALAGCGSDTNTSGSADSGSGSSSESSAAKIEDCYSGTLKAEGSSAQKNAIESAISSYQDACADATINYNPSGSGAGIKNFTAGQVDFAGSDSSLKPEEVTAAEATCKSPAWNLPMVVGPIAVAYKVDGVDKLVLDADTTAGIFSGKITKWNAPEIAKLNSGVKLPDTDIKVFFRSDESGTTENFTKYLKAASPTGWTAEPAKKWGGSIGEGKEKSAGVASAVQAQEGGITYVEWSYAAQNKLGIAQIDTGSGPVELTGESVGKMVATAQQTGTGNDLAMKLDYATKEAGAYPITLVTYEIVCSKYSDSAKAAGVKSFLTHFSSDDVQSGLEKDGYAPLPSEVASKVKDAVTAIG